MKNKLKTFLQNRCGLYIRSATRSSLKERPVPLLDQSARRLLYFSSLLRKIPQIDGDIVECGVGWGRSLFCLCVCLEVLKQKRMIYGFDSFEGFPEPSVVDKPEEYGLSKGRYATNAEGVKRYLINSGISENFVQERISLIKGFFNETLADYPGKGIALLHLDVDLYQSYKDCLEGLYDRVLKGGIVAFDEYQNTTKYKAARMAIDEFINGREKIIRSDIIDRYYLVKSKD